MRSRPLPRIVRFEGRWWADMGDGRIARSDSFRSLCEYMRHPWFAPAGVEVVR